MYPQIPLREMGYSPISHPIAGWDGMGAGIARGGNDTLNDQNEAINHDVDSDGVAYGKYVYTLDGDRLEDEYDEFVAI